MPDPNLLEYLDQTITLERECYTLNRLIEFGESQRTVSQEKPTEPVYPEPPTFPPPPEKPHSLVLDMEWPDYDKLMRRPLIWVLFIAGGLLSGLAVYFFDIHNIITGPFRGNFVLTWLAFTILTGFCILVVYLGIPFSKEMGILSRAEQQDKRQFSADKTAYFAHNAQMKVIHRQQCHELKTAYETALLAAQARNEAAGQVIPVLDALQRRFQAAQYKLHQTLAQLYALELIYPKCHNLIALASLHEYLSSGRCDGLSGADGAYSLLKQSISDHQIIYKVTELPENLEALETHQYKLYTVLTATHQTIAAISRAIMERLHDLTASASTPVDGADLTEQPTSPTTDQVEQYLGKLDTIHDGALAYLARHV